MLSCGPFLIVGLWLYYCRVMMLLLPSPPITQIVSLFVVSRNFTTSCVFSDTHWQTKCGLSCAHTIFSCIHILQNFEFKSPSIAFTSQMRACASWWPIGVCPLGKHHGVMLTLWWQSLANYGANETFQYLWPQVSIIFMGF